MLNFAFMYFRMERDVSSGSDTDTDLDIWMCELCKQKPVNVLTLEQQVLYSETVILRDVNGDEWLRCNNCDTKFHIKCVNNLPTNVCECFFNLNNWNMYICEKCGWFNL